jgi:hypothetical protein
MKKQTDRNEDINKVNTDSTREENTRSGGMNNASGNRGGTTDMDSEALTINRPNTTERGSGLTTKRTVTGSDFDGQAA